jgi:hypothetical protein
MLAIYSPLLFTAIFLVFQFIEINTDSVKGPRKPAAARIEQEVPVAEDNIIIIGRDNPELEARKVKIQNHITEIKALVDGCEADCELLEKSLTALEEDLADVDTQANDTPNSGQDSRFVEVISSSGESIPCHGDSFRPDPYDPVKVVNLNFHFPVIDNPASPGMFVEDHDGIGNTRYNVYLHIENLVRSANEHLKSNVRQSSQEFLDIPVLPTKLLARRNTEHLVRIPERSNPGFRIYYNYSTSQIGNFLDELYGIKYSGVFPISTDGINLVFQEQYGAPSWAPPKYALDSNNQRILTADGKGYVLEEFGRFNIRNGSAVEKKLPKSQPPIIVMANEWMGHIMQQKIWNDRQDELTNDASYVRFTPWERSKHITSGIGSVGGLDYTWSNSNLIDTNTFVMCDDHPQQKSPVWCGEGSYNNVMDANCSKNSWSPCQLEIVHRNFHNHLKNLLYLPREADRNYDHYIPEGLGEVVWDAPHDLIGDLYIGKGTKLRLMCNVTKPVDGRIFPETSVIGLQNVRSRE